MDKDIRINRDQLCRELQTRLEKGRQALLLGPAQWGKTSLARQLQATYEHSSLKRVIYLDFFALRHQSPQALDHATVRWLIENEMAYRQFANIHQTQKKRLLHTYLSERCQPSDLLIIDHLEVVVRAAQLLEWFKKLSFFLEKKGVSVLWIERVADYEASLLAQARIPQPDILEISPLSKEEIAAWLDRVALSEMSGKRVTAADIFTVTQGNPSITKNLYGYFQDPEERDPGLSYYQERASKQYMGSCQRVWQALTEHPGEIETWRSSPSKRLKNKLWLSGAFRRRPDGSLIEASPIHEKRLQGLLVKDRFLSVLANQPVSEIAPEFNQYAEITATPLWRSIAESKSDLEAFKTLRDYFINYFKLGSVRFYLRDGGHPLIWKEILVHKQGLDIGEKLFAGTTEVLHDFTRAALTGRQQNIGNRTYLFPVIGPTDQVDLICKVDLRKTRRFTFLYQRGKVQQIQQSLLFIQPVLSQRIAMYAYQHDLRMSRDLQKRIEAKVFRPDENELSGVLEESKMDAVGVFKPPIRRGSAWSNVSLQSREDLPLQFDIQAVFTNVNEAQLSALADSSKPKQQVVGHREACQIFPGLNALMAYSTLFIRPITITRSNNASERWLVCFIDLEQKRDVNRQSQAILSHQQQHLLLLAERALEIVYREERQRVFMSALLRGISHELKHYIKDIAWTAELLQDELESIEHRAQCEMIEKNARLMSKRMDRLKQLAMTDKGEPQRLNLRELVSKIVQDVLGRKEEPGMKRVPIEYEGVDRDTHIKMDKGQFRMALENLLRNAQEALQSVEWPLILIYTEKVNIRHSRVKLIVADNGPGVRASLAGNLFDPFVTGHTGTVPDGKPDRARGVGLTLVRTVVYLAGGEVTFQRVNHETRFEMSLPVA